MDSETKAFCLKRIAGIWATSTVLLTLTGLIVLAYSGEARKFVGMLVTLNLLSFVAFSVFRKRIEMLVAVLMDDADGLSFCVRYRHEKLLGAIMLTLLFAFICYALFLAVFDIEGYTLLIREDGIIEYGSAVFWFLAAVVLSVRLPFLSKNVARRWHLLPNLALVAFCIVCSGEEISWGQRIFGTTTPELLKAINVQQETNLHNIGSISVFANVFFLSTVVFFLVIPYMARRNPRIGRTLRYVHFPIPNRFVVLVFIGTLFAWGFVGIWYGTLGFHPFTFLGRYYTQMDDEIFEFLAAYSFFCFSVMEGVKRVSIVERPPAAR